MAIHPWSTLLPQVTVGETVWSGQVWRAPLRGCFRLLSLPHTRSSCRVCVRANQCSHGRDLVSTTWRMEGATFPSLYCVRLFTVPWSLQNLSPTLWNRCAAAQEGPRVEKVCNKLTIEVHACQTKETTVS